MMDGPASTNFHQPAVVTDARSGPVRRHETAASAPAATAKHIPTISIAILVPPTIARSPPSSGDCGEEERDQMIWVSVHMCLQMLSGNCDRQIEDRTREDFPSSLVAALVAQEFHQVDAVLRAESTRIEADE